MVYAVLKMHTPLGKCIRSLGLGLGFWDLVSSLKTSPNLLLGLIVRSCTMIDKIVLSSRPGIPDFGRYKMGCLHPILLISKDCNSLIPIVTTHKT